MAQEKTLREQIGTDSVIKTSRVKGYVKVHSTYIFTELEWGKKNLRYKENAHMIDTLLTWMCMRTTPWYVTLMDVLTSSDKYSKKYKEWINLRADHWLVNMNARAELMKVGLI